MITQRTSGTGARQVLALLAIVAAWTFPSANAADPPGNDCTKIADYNQMVGCFARDSQKATAAMARTYDAVLARAADAPRRDLLVRSQDAWIAYRDAYCGFVSSAVEGGSLQPMVRNTCFANVTRIRTRELEYQLTCQEGDVSCVVPARRP